jgi:hypothetical protein
MPTGAMMDDQRAQDANDDYQRRSEGEDEEEFLPLSQNPGVDVIWIAIEEKAFVEEFMPYWSEEHWEIISENRKSRATFDGDLKHKLLQSQVGLRE